MKIELHLLQNFVPSNLNRDDTGAPKDCDFGGHRRARISSQCLKRAIRSAFELGGHVVPEELAARTKRLVDQVAERLTGTHGRDPGEAIAMVQTAVRGAGLELKDNKTQYLLFLPRRCIDELAAFVDRNWQALAEAGTGGDEAAPADGKKRSAKASKKQAKADFPAALGKELEDILKDRAGTPDLALFGRMIADKAGWNVDAACQVAHALSTNRVVMDFDFFTAIDDFRPADTAGSDMMGTVQLNSSCFYRYAVVDIRELAKNLDSNDKGLVRRTTEAFLHAAIAAIPTGKQNSTAAQNPPSYALVVVRDRSMPVSLANAFLQPVQPSSTSDLVDLSIDRLEQYYGNLCRMYGATGIVGAVTCADRQLPAAESGLARVSSIAELVAATLKSIEA